GINSSASIRSISPLLPSSTASRPGPACGTGHILTRPRPVTSRGRAVRRMPATRAAPGVKPGCGYRAALTWCGRIHGGGRHFDPQGEHTMATTSPWPLIHAEREALAADLGTLTGDQWATPSLCGDWAVRDVLGHMIATAKM